MNKRNLICLIAVMLLCGCSRADAFINQQVLNKSGIVEDDEYKKYQLHFENGEVDSQGYYMPFEDNAGNDSSEPKKGSIHVTISTNSMLNIKYYYDSEYDNEITTQDCYLSPGESIYASNPIAISESTNKYSFDKFEIYEINGSNRILFEECTVGSGLIFTVPAESTFGDYSIVPIGKLENRNLTFYSFITDETGEKLINDGKWLLNNEEVSGNNYSFSPTKSYIARYDFSKLSDQYYFEESEPEISEVSDSIATFLSQTSNSNVESFVSKLRKYTLLTIKNKKSAFVNGVYGIASLQVNGEEYDVDNQNYSIKLKNGDSIMIVVKKGFKLVPSVSEDGLDISNPITLLDGTQYNISINSVKEYSPILTVTKETATHGEYVQRIINNGKINLYKENGDAITEGDTIDDNESIMVTIKPNEGYYVSGKNVDNSIYSKKMKYSDYIENQDEIINSHPILRYIRITLNSVDEYGECEFEYNNQNVSGTISVKQNDKIVLKYSLTSEKYSIEKPTGIINQIVSMFKKNSASIAITVTEDMDNTTINRNDYIKISMNGGDKK